ncbi:hypothetical protein LU293_04395 [Moraxella nasovis]|uniref:hypothetical protein n=1 Tax=Moraxella nasovis TaxID=2904121 RepID=UPI001F5FFFF6|nr:hypothetical protein [Moraxella nasovis]UNU74143.1 hypothetical protein LU293_04395 [Moraxella nasovis]
MKHKILNTLGFFMMLVVICLALLKCFDIAITQQAKADFEECMSWKLQGYNIQCDPKKWGVEQ